jgi:hypothetical protein
MMLMLNVRNLPPADAFGGVDVTSRELGIAAEAATAAANTGWQPTGSCKTGPPADPSTDITPWQGVT